MPGRPHQSLDIDTWQYGETDFQEFIHEMLVELGINDYLNQSPGQLNQFLDAVRLHYHAQTPFHNFGHCFCVTQMMYLLLTEFTSAALAKQFSIRDKAILMLASICHDLDHRGLNNAYQINAGTELALIYNDQSPLENHHCSTGFRLMRQCGLLESLSAEDYRTVRRGIIECILATDISRQRQILAEFYGVLPGNGSIGAQPLNNLPTDETDRLKWMRLLIKAADLCVEIRPAPVAHRWVNALFKEFNAQYALEERQKLPTQSWMAAGEGSDERRLTQDQFIRFVMLPVYEALDRAVGAPMLLTRIHKALDYYK